MSAGAAGGQGDSAKGWPVRMLGLGPGWAREKGGYKKMGLPFRLLNVQLTFRSLLSGQRVPGASITLTQRSDGWIKEEMKGKAWVSGCPFTFS